MSNRLEAFLVDMEGKHAGQYMQAISDLLVAIAMKDKPAAAAARTRLEDVVSATMAIGSVIGATEMLQQAAGALAAEHPEHFAADYLPTMVAFELAEPSLGNVTFTEAVEEMLTRVPVTLVPSAERAADAIAKLYSRGRFTAFAKAMENSVTERVQELIAAAMRDGVTEAQAGLSIVQQVELIREKTSAWTEGYARMAFRTNVNTAITAGRFRQARDPDVAAVIPAFRFDAVMDVDTRHNHAAANGRIYLTANPVWGMIAPPLGYNCRCQVSLVTRPQLRRMGRLSESGGVMEDSVPAGAGPDPGFRHARTAEIFT